jgi:hypothetical protein
MSTIIRVSLPLSRKGEDSLGAPTNGPAMSLSDRLPRSKHSYDCYDPAATDELFAELTAKQAELEAELARYRLQEQLVSKTLLSAMSYAMRIREDARREAELVLRKTRAETAKQAAAAERAERGRNDAERELLRLRQITQEMQAGLSTFLTAKLQQLESEAEDEAQPKTEDGAPQPPSAADIDQTLANALEAALQSEER